MAPLVEQTWKLENQVPGIEFHWFMESSEESSVLSHMNINKFFSSRAGSGAAFPRFVIPELDAAVAGEATTE